MVNSQRWRAKVAVLTMAALLPFAGGCAGLEKKMQVEVVIFNYNPQPIAEFVIANQAVPGYEDSYRPGSAGGGSVCCIEVKPGEVEVQWMYAGEEGAPRAGQTDRAIGVVPVPAAGRQYLGVHIYPGSIVEFTLTPNIPHEKERGAAYE